MRIKYVLLICSLLILSGCSNNTKATTMNNTNQVQNVLNQQISDQESESSTVILENTTNVQDEITNRTDVENQTTEEQSTDEQTTSENESEDNQSTGDSSIDYDLTQMGSDMVYATVFQMMSTPEEYEGKMIRMQGRYYSTWYDATSKYYHYVVIQDALACCAQGMEFVWDDGEHIYPDDYPEENDDVVVTGIFETYKEDGDDSLYCRLKNATMKMM